MIAETTRFWNRGTEPRCMDYTGYDHISYCGRTAKYCVSRTLICADSTGIEAERTRKYHVCGLHVRKYMYCKDFKGQYQPYEDCKITAIVR